MIPSSCNPSAFQIPTFSSFVQSQQLPYSPGMASESYTMDKSMSTNVHENSEHQDRDLNSWDNLDHVAKEGLTVNDQRDMQRMEKKQEFRRNFRFLITVGFTYCIIGT